MRRNRKQHLSASESAIEAYIVKRIGAYPMMPMPVEFKKQIRKRIATLTLSQETAEPPSLYPKSLRWAGLLGICIFLLQNGILFTISSELAAGDQTENFILYTTIGVGNLILIFLTVGHFFDKLSETFDNLEAFLLSHN